MGRFAGLSVPSAGPSFSVGFGRQARTGSPQDLEWRKTPSACLYCNQPGRCRTLHDFLGDPRFCKSRAPALDTLRAENVQKGTCRYSAGLWPLTRLTSGEPTAATSTPKVPPRKRRRRRQKRAPTSSTSSSRLDTRLPERSITTRFE